MPRWPHSLLLVTAVVAGIGFSNSLQDSTRTNFVPAYSADALDALLATMRTSNIDTGNSIIRLSGVATDAEWTTRLGTFEESLADGVELQLDVFVIDEGADLRKLCKTMFANLAIGDIGFSLSGSDLRPVSRPTLDRLAEFARDCPQSDILITGHTDGTGAAASNESLSRARAQIVADYLVARGAHASQLHVRGVGAQQPIADDATRMGRARNRRIEFELRESE
jgi:outer membrane protein OmpA-like peptidoglycan-associated protein